jgi:hypothetical protein
VSKAELSKKVDTTDFNTFKDSVVTKTELSEYALKSELYNDTDLKNRVVALEYKLRDYDDRELAFATKEELNDYVKRTELPAPYDDTSLRQDLESTIDNVLGNKENEFNSRFVAKDDLRTLVTEIVSQLKSENN